MLRLLFTIFLVLVGSILYEHFRELNPGTVTLTLGNTARYDADVEAQATPIRAHIAALQRQVAAESERLNALYAYQAGPQPEKEATT